MKRREVMKTAKILLFLFAAQSAAGTALAQPLGDPDIPHGQRLVYKFTTTYKSTLFLREIKEREEVDESVHLIERYEESGRCYYRINDTGTRINGYMFAHATILERGEHLMPVSFRASDSNPAGRTIRAMHANFDDEALSYPDDTYPIFSAMTAIRGLDFSPGARKAVHLWIAPTEIYRIWLEVEEKETIKVPAGTFECYRVELKPDIRSIMPIGDFLASLIQPFIPTYHFWYSAERSHPLVRFEGSLGGAGASNTVVELKEIEWGKEAGGMWWDGGG